MMRHGSGHHDVVVRGVVIHGLSGYNCIELARGGMLMWRLVQCWADRKTLMSVREGV